MNTETSILAAMLAFGIACSLILLIDGLAKLVKRRQRRVSIAKLNDCKPGCFMQCERKGDTV